MENHSPVDKSCSYWVSLFYNVNEKSVNMLSLQKILLRNFLGLNLLQKWIFNTGHSQSVSGKMRHFNWENLVQQVLFQPDLGQAACNSQLS